MNITFFLLSELETVQANLEESRNETAYFESLVQRYEQRVFDLEELEVELREKLALLEGAVQFAVWWNTVLMNQVSFLMYLFVKQHFSKLNFGDVNKSVCITCHGHLPFWQF